MSLSGNKKNFYSERTFLIVSSFLILFFGLWFVSAYFWPTLKEVFSYHIQLQEAKKEYLSQKKKLEEVQKIFRELSEKGEVREILSLSLPVKANYTQILGEINSIANLSQVSLDSVSVKSKKLSISSSNRRRVKIVIRPEDLVKPFKSIEIAISGDGTYENVKKFISFLEKDIRLMSVNSFSLNKVEIFNEQKQNNEQTEPIINFDLKLNCFEQSIVEEQQ